MTLTGFSDIETKGADGARTLSRSFRLSLVTPFAPRSPGMLTLQHPQQKSVRSIDKTETTESSITYTRTFKGRCVLLLLRIHSAHLGIFGFLKEFA